MARQSLPSWPNVRFLPWQLCSDDRGLTYQGQAATVSRYIPRRRPNPDKVQRWMTFLRNYKDVMAGMDFFTVPTVQLRDSGLLFRHRTWPPSHPSLQRNIQPDLRVGDSATAGCVPVRHCPPVLGFRPGRDLLEYTYAYFNNARPHHGLSQRIPRQHPPDLVFRHHEVVGAGVAGYFDWRGSLLPSED